MGFLYFLASLAASALTWLIFWQTGKIMITGAVEYNASELETADRIDLALASQRLDTYVNAVKTLNARRLYNIMSDTFYHQTLEEIQGFQKLGIRREIDIEAFGGMEDGILTTDGKNKWGTASLKCRYTERFVDVTADQVLHTTHYPKACILFQLTRSDHRERGKEMYCVGCGQLIGTNGEVYICSSCGASYTSDSYDWSINGLRVTNEEIQKTNPVIAYTTWYIMAMLALLPILSLFAGSRPGLAVFILIASIINLGIVSFFWYWTRNIAAKGVIELRKIDPLFSYAKLDGRIGYLISLFYNAMNFNPYIIKPFMEPDVFNELRQNYRPNGSCVLNIEYPGGGCTVSGITKHGGRNYIETANKVILTVLDSSRRVSQIKKNIKFQICRGENVKTTLKSNPEVLICQNCGASVNLTANGKCKFCGADTDLSQTDWILGRVDSSMLV